MKRINSFQNVDVDYYCCYLIAGRWISSQTFYNKTTSTALAPNWQDIISSWFSQVTKVTDDPLYGHVLYLTQQPFYLNW